jgi:sialidase-1
MRKFRILLLLLAILGTITGCSGDYTGREIPGIETATLDIHKVPVFRERENKGLVRLTLEVQENTEPLELTSVELFFEQSGDPTVLKSISAEYYPADDENAVPVHFGMTQTVGQKSKINGKGFIEPGNQVISLDFQIREDALLEKSFRIEKVRLTFKGAGKTDLVNEDSFAFRPGIVLRAAGQDNCDTYRIPGIITTGKGTLIAVYDNRYNNSKDLQEDVDVGMSRSTDGGQTWEPMRVIMDMGEWGGRPERLNGIGDPSILYDPNTGTIWVAALWMSGSSYDQMLWWASQPGMSPEETGQFILVKSTDDGITWSEPINITGQIKDPVWQLLLQGPGAGITMSDGTLVFPAQFKADTGEKALDGGQYTSHSTIIYSRDGGETWQIGTGAKPNTTEAQVVQLTDGSLMLNMRDDINRRDKGDTNGRAVSVTHDLGNTWTTHPSSNSALPEPNCMASLITADVPVAGQKQQVLFFSNPNSKTTRTRMTIKTSADGGHTWPEAWQTELYAPAGFGYSCMTMVDDQHIGIVYEGVKDLYFQKIPVRDIIK